MLPSYKFPRSHGSLDLTDPATVPPSSGSQSQPSLLITDSYGHQQAPPAGSIDEQYLAKYTSVTQSLLNSGGLAQPNPAHLSTSSTYPSKTLSRISEYSESAYSSASRSRESQQEPSTSSTHSHNSSAPSLVDPAFALGTPSMPFPSPPQQAYVPTSAPLPATKLVVPAPAPIVLSVTNPDLPEGLRPTPSLKKHHLPSRPLTTPVPTSNPVPLPVPIDNFAAPPGQERSGSPWNNALPMPSQHHEAMVELPARAPVLAHNNRDSQHVQKDSEATTAWMTAEDEKYDSMYAGAYDPVSLVRTQSEEPSTNRFTLDDQEKISQRKGSASSASGMGAEQPWHEEDAKKGNNRRVFLILLALLVIGVAVGVGVGVSQKKASERNNLNHAASAESVILPPSSSPRTLSLATSGTSPSRTVAANAVETFSTTFGFERDGKMTVVPLTYTIPTSYWTRGDGRWQFTETVVLPDIGAPGSFTSDLRFRVAPTVTDQAAGIETGAVAKVRRNLQSERVKDARRWERRHQDLAKKRARVIR
ncbi:serine/arginine repetitive matrix 1 [Rhodotorula toruloides]|uniref:Serine/arginine repetitive matrix 1 n=1 Tax=Rhodotorula toruloides TaxID=5286 RepID=A0A511KQ79_RHOTO|nr:serine/arginine repetitive matrix 1 [Rhodotorula toruloides]